MKHITARDVMERPGTVFVFGDNLARAGFGGQASAMRGHPNAIGVPTKRWPGRHACAFFTDADWESRPAVRFSIVTAFHLIEGALRAGRDVVIPANGLGTGLAELPTRAPLIHAEIERRIADLERRYSAP